MILIVGHRNQTLIARCAHLSLRQCEWFRQVHTLGVELQERGEVPTLHGVVQPAGIRLLIGNDVPPLCVLCHNVLLSGIPGKGFDEKSVMRGGKQTYDLVCFEYTHMSLRGNGLTESFGRPASMTSLNLVLPMLTANWWVTQK